MVEDKDSVSGVGKLGFKSWQWIFYVIGWSGVLSLLFWIYQAAAHQMYNMGDPFFSSEFHKRVYRWGWVVVIFCVFVLVFAFSGLLYE